MDTRQPVLVGAKMVVFVMIWLPISSATVSLVGRANNANRISMSAPYGKLANQTQLANAWIAKTIIIASVCLVGKANNVSSILTIVLVILVAQMRPAARI